MILLKEAQPDEAYSLSRTLVECALILRHLTRNEQEKFSESAKFIEFSRTTKNFWLHHVRRNIAGDLSDQDTSRYAEEWGLSDAKPREIFRGWSGDFQTFDCLKKDHPLDAPNTLDVRISAHAVDYTQPSQFVHCSQQALDNFAPNIGVPYQLKSSVGESVDTHPHVLFILITYLHEVVNYCLFGLALDRPDSLDRHFNKTLQQIVQLDD